MFATLLIGNETKRLHADEWLSEIERMTPAAVIFDCDGTLVESSDAHRRSMQTATREQGFDMPSHWYLERTGLDRLSLFQDFSAFAGESFDISRAMETSIECFADHVSSVRPIRETVRALQVLKEQGFPVAVATNAEHEIAVQSLGATDLLHRIDALSTISDGVQPKPSPQLFELAARRLGVDAPDVCVFEDSEQGVQAARAALMSVFHINRCP